MRSTSAAGTAFPSAWHKAYDRSCLWKRPIAFWQGHHVFGLTGMLWKVLHRKGVNAKISKTIYNYSRGGKMDWMRAF